MYLSMTERTVEYSMSLLQVSGGQQGWLTRPHSGWLTRALSIPTNCLLSHSYSFSDLVHNSHPGSGGWRLYPTDRRELSAKRREESNSLDLPAAREMHDEGKGVKISQTRSDLLEPLDVLSLRQRDMHQREMDKRRTVEVSPSSSYHSLNYTKS